MSDKPALYPQGPVGDQLRTAAHNIVAEARTAIEDASLIDAVAIHDFRKAMKRWRALLRLLEPFLGEAARGLRIAARDLARELAGPRDVQSALDALADATGKKSSPQNAIAPRTVATIRSRLEATRSETEAAILTAPRRIAIGEALCAADAAIDRWPVDAITFEEITDELAAGYRRARRLVPDDWPAAGPDELHELRQRVVEHRYQMELVEPLWPRLGRLWVDEAQRLRNRLGAFNDLALLATLTAPHRPLARWRSRLAPVLAARQAGHRRASARLAARLFAESPRAFRRRLNALWHAGRPS
jgi:CHAD domain-containing protein